MDVNVYNDDEREHRLHVAVNASVDEGANTSTDAALVSSERIEPGGSRALGDLAIPADAEALYVWCSIGDHEAAGESLVVLVEPAYDEEQDEAPGPGGGLLLLAVGVAAGARGRL